MRHRLNRRTHHDLPYLCHIDTIQVIINRELHDLDLIRTGFKQYFTAFICLHFSHSFSVAIKEYAPPCHIF